MANYTRADFAYLDTFTTVFAVFATYMLTKKVLENWLYWVVIDAVSIYIYIRRSCNWRIRLLLQYVHGAGHH